MGLCLFFLPNFQGVMFIQGATFISDSRVVANPVFWKAIPTKYDSNGLLTKVEKYLVEYILLRKITCNLPKVIKLEKWT